MKEDRQRTTLGTWVLCGLAGIMLLWASYSYFMLGLP